MNIKTLIIFLILLFPLSGEAHMVYELLPQLSKIEFVVIKDGNVEVKGEFKEINGWHEVPGAAINIDLNSLDTGNPARDKNIKEIFFETQKSEKFSYAVFSVKNLAFKKEIDQSLVLEGTLQMHGHIIPLTIPVMVQYQEDGMHVITPKEGVIVFEPWGLSEGVSQLMKICGHKQLDSKAMVKVHLVFSKTPTI